MTSVSDRGARRQLLIGLDAMEWSLVTRWASEGKLPTLRQLLARGSAGELATTSAQLPDTVWASLYTGTNPAKFEKFFYVQYDGTTMGLRHVMDDAITRPPFWDYLSQAGVRVGVVDVPKFAASRHINGFQLTNWGAHATKTTRTSRPLDLLDEITARFGTHPVGDCDKTDANPHALRALAKRVLDGVRVHGQVFRHLMREQTWDVFFAAFSAPHCIGHHFYHGTDPTHPRHRTAIEWGIADAMERVYRAIDEEIGEMLRLVDSDTRVMVFSAHGMGPLRHASWNLPEILDLLGYGDRPASRRTPNETRTAKRNFWRMLKMTVPGALQYWIRDHLPRAAQDWLLFRWYSGGKNWRHCRAFSIPNNDSVGAIRLGVKGRDRFGQIAPGEEYRRVCHEIADTLSELCDPVTGRRVVRKISFAPDEFHGPFLDQLPDLTVLWDQSFHWEALQSPRIGTLRLSAQDSRTGAHTSHGFLIVAGAGVPAGQRLYERSTYDIAPTILDAAGIAIPGDFDGHPVLFDAPAARA
jgi:predicted AlkP superfamily phosphohydrolase/phosphomutase